jgi:hypothetical protein
VNSTADLEKGPSIRYRRYRPNLTVAGVAPLPFVVNPIVADEPAASDGW